MKSSHRQGKSGGKKGEAAGANASGLKKVHEKHGAHGLERERLSQGKDKY